VKKRQDDDRALLAEAEETPQPLIDDVVEKVLEGVSEPEKKKTSSLSKITSKHRK